MTERSTDEIATIIVEYTGESVDFVIGKAIQGSKNTIKSFSDRYPRTPAEFREWYGSKESGYIYDLLAWNVSPLYEKLTAPLKDIRGKRILVIGSGLGSDADILADLNEVDVFELPGYLREFCRFRLQDRAWILDHETILDIPKNGEYDLIVGIDVLEHIHPEEFETTMDALKRY